MWTSDVAAVEDAELAEVVHLATIQCVFRKDEAEQQQNRIQAAAWEVARQCFLQLGAEIQGHQDPPASYLAPSMAARRAKEYRDIIVAVVGALHNGAFVGEHTSDAMLSAVPEEVEGYCTRLRRERDECVGALVFYADGKNWWMSGQAFNDKGAAARNVLATIQPTSMPAHPPPAQASMATPASVRGDEIGARPEPKIVSDMTMTSHIPSRDTLKQFCDQYAQAKREGTETATDVVLNRLMSYIRNGRPAP
jgi:hypothetical protein